LEITADSALAIAFPVLAAGPDAVYGRARVEVASRPDVVVPCWTGCPNAGERMDAQDQPSVKGSNNSRWTNEGRMSIRALRYLIALAECLNFTRAAERCSVTQSTLSIQLRKLEEYLGVRLFERDRAHVALTDEGRKVLRFARVAIRAADRIVSVSRNGRARPTSIVPTEVLIEEINCQRVPID
jgi:hypothetical protein